MPTVLHPTAGYILDAGQGAMPGPLPPAERETLRALAQQVAEIASLPQQAEKRELWYRHNRLEKVRPMLLVFPEDSWAEIIGEDQLALSHPFWRQWEWYLRHLIYRHSHLVDDFVVEPTLYVNRAVRGSGWGLSPRYQRTEQAKGSYVWDAPIQDPADIRKLHFPTVEVDEAETRSALEATGDALGDVLPVCIHCRLPAANLIGEATTLRGLEQVMIDMHERPQWLHELMGFITEGFMAGVRYLEENGYLTLNNGHHYNDSGGLGYSTELPAPGFDGQHVRLRDLWGFGVAQELAWVGPVQHEEFVLNYQLRLLEQCGLNAYGCCESYAKKFAMLKRIPRLRRISVSPWCDTQVTARELEERYVISWKPNPAMIVGQFSPDAIRAYIRQNLEAMRGCVVEIVHKDTFTIEHEPQRLETWCRIAREEIERISQ
jgi:hypothetical protein